MGNKHVIELGFHGAASLFDREQIQRVFVERFVASQLQQFGGLYFLGITAHLDLTVLVVDTDEARISS